MAVKITRYHAAPPTQALGEQVVQLVHDNITDLSMLSVPPSNHLFEIYQWALPIEIGTYMSRIGRVASEPVELLLAIDESGPVQLIGFLLYSPVPTHPEACGVNYMAVKQSHRRQGIGTSLMKELVAQHPHVELTCPIKKVPFYESVGFQVLDTHSTQVVMNTRSASTVGQMAVLDIAPLYESSDAQAIHHRLAQRWGQKAMAQAKKQLERHAEQLARQSRAFVDARLASKMT